MIQSPSAKKRLPDRLIEVSETPGHPEMSEAAGASGSKYEFIFTMCLLVLRYPPSAENERLVIAWDITSVC